MHLLLMFAVLSVFVAPEGSVGPVGAAGYRALAALAGMALIGLVAWGEAAWVVGKLRLDPSRRRATIGRYRWLRAVHLLLLLAVFFGVSFGLRWGQLVRFNWGLDGAVLVDELLILAPLLVPLMISLAAFYEVDRVVRLIATEHCASPAPLWSRWGYVEYHLRHTLGIVLVPVLLLSGSLDLLAICFPQAGANHAGVLLAAVLFAMALGFPLLLRLIWKARPLPAGPLRERLERVSRRERFGVRDILIWDTQGAVANAAVAGFVPGLRYVLISDGLLKHFSEPEIEAVFGHEVGHVKHAHLTLRLLSFLPLWGLIALLQNELPQGWLTETESMAGWLPAVVRHFALMGAYLLLVFGYFSRRLERQADVFGCRVASCGRLDCPPHEEPSALTDASAARKLCPTGIGTFIGMLEKLADFNGMNRNTPSWQHFSIARRIRFLESLQHDPSAERQFQRSLVRLRGVLGVTIAVVFALVGWSWMR